MIESIAISMLEVPKYELLHYSIMAKILIFMLCFVTTDIPNLIIKLSQELRLISIMDQYDSIVDLNIM